ncbi:WhiB family transcriptional regulator [Actinomadura sp. NPDC047616]|uniref:WhiB family transcriptional regulator n=1 Tax=Actinomadura sp. NPDC047616 TaxID=3155914 RepID=UPI00340C17B0
MSNDEPLALPCTDDPDLFFSDDGTYGDARIYDPDKVEKMIREAKSLCASCDHRQACLNQALANDERSGIWGGYTARERRDMIRRSRRGAA